MGDKMIEKREMSTGDADAGRFGGAEVTDD